MYTVHYYDTLEMIAPLKAISQAFRLRKEAEQRIIRETDRGDVCAIFVNGATYKIMKVENVRYDRVEAPLPTV